MRLTVAELKQQLEDVPDDYEVWRAEGGGALGVVGAVRIDVGRRRVTVP